jgi:hypothetical protein
MSKSQPPSQKVHGQKANLSVLVYTHLLTFGVVVGDCISLTLLAITAKNSPVITPEQDTSLSAHRSVLKTWFLYSTGSAM